MLLRVRFKKQNGNGSRWRTGHKPLALLCSAAIHGGLIALAFLPSAANRDPASLYQSVIVPLAKEHKVIYYDFRQELPAVSPTNPSRPTTTVSAEARKSAQTILTAPREKSGTQLVWIPQPRVRLRTEVPAPNLIAIEQTVAVPPRPEPKTFQAPERPKRVPPPVPTLPNAPRLAAAEAKDFAISSILNQRAAPLRQFVAPAPEKSVSAAAPAVLPSAPSIRAGSNGQKPAVTSLFGGPAGPPPKPFSAPQPVRAAAGSEFGAPALTPPPPDSGTARNTTASIAILGLNPASTRQIPRPEGNHPARIETGTPVPGATQAELGGGTSPISVPDVSIQGRPAALAATAVRPPRESTASSPAAGLATPQMPQVLATTPHVSAPLWPTNRFFPAPVEHHFAGRVAYVTVIPGSQSGGDWVVWFADLSPEPNGGSPLMRPPTLMKAGALPPILAGSDHGTGKIRLSGVIRKDGRLASLTELAGGAPDRELTAALQAWQFGPAQRNGVSIDADAVIEIPVVFGKLSSR
ncbi:MAG TPA: hypothetical protein VJ732_15310 [Bryobacteraceae bacterium]|nr:hypothetical protein [Bryobacteraceae bacterium]